MSNEEMLYASFSEALGLAAELINDGLKYNSIPEWDSVAHMVLISVIEEKFGIMLDTNDILDLSSVGNAKTILGKQGVSFP